MRRNRYFVYGCSVFISLTQSCCFINFVPMYQLMDKIGILHSEIADPKLREIAYGSALGYGVSMTMLAGTVTGVVQALVGCKVLLLICSTLEICGWISIFFVDNYNAIVFGAMCLGATMQLTVAGHVGIGAFFPEISAFLLTVQGCASDVSTYVPKTMLLATRFTNDQVRPVIYGYLCILLVNALIDLLIAPRDWSKEAEKHLEDEIAQAESSEMEKAHLLEKNQVTVETELKEAVKRAAPKLWSASLCGQLCSVEFVLFFVYFLLSFVRVRKYYASNFKPIVSLVIPNDPTTVEEWTQIYADGNTLAFVVGLGLGALAQLYGITRTMIFHNLVAIVMMGVSLTPYPALQYVGIFAFMVGCFQFSMMNVFLAETFGYKHIVILQGALLTCCGIFCIMYDYWWERVFNNVFEASHRRVLTFWLVVSIALLVVLFVMDYRCQKAKEKVKHVTTCLSPAAKDVLMRNVRGDSLVHGSESGALTAERRRTMELQRTASLLLRDMKPN